MIKKIDFSLSLAFFIHLPPTSFISEINLHYNADFLTKGKTESSCYTRDLCYGLFIIMITVADLSVLLCVDTEGAVFLGYYTALRYVHGENNRVLETHVGRAAAS